jgi:hypothetical protein
MRPSIRSAALLVVSGAGLAACSGGDDGSLGKEVGDVRADVQRLQKENEKLASQVATQTRRIDGLAEDLSHVRGLAMDVKMAPAPKAASAAAGAAADGSSPDGGAALVTPADGTATTPELAAVKRYLGTEEGKKILEAAVQAERDERNREQQKRSADAWVDRLAKIANLTDDQVKKMKDVLDQAAIARSDAWSAMRDLGADATPEQRDEARQTVSQKMDDLRKQTDDQVRPILSSTQFDQYQQEQDKLRSTMRGFGGGSGGARNGRQSGN